MLDSTDIKLVVNNGWCCKHFLFQVIPGQDLQGISRRKDSYDTFTGRDIDPAVGTDGRRIVGAGGPQPFAVEQLSAFRVHAGNDTAVLDHVDAAIIVERRRNLGRGFFFLPENICSCHTVL